MVSPVIWACGFDKSEVWDDWGTAQCSIGLALMGASGLLIVSVIIWISQGNSMGCATPFKQSWIERFCCLETVGAGIALCGGTQTLLAGLVLSAEGVAASPLTMMEGIAGALAWLLTVIAVRCNFMRQRTALPNHTVVALTLAALAALLAILLLLIGDIFSLTDIPMAVSAVLQLTFLGLALTEQQHIGVHSTAQSGAGLDLPLLGTSAQTGPSSPPPGPGGTLNRLGFFWVTPLLWRGSIRQLEEEDLFDLEPHLEPSLCSWVLWDKWTQERSRAAEASTMKGNIIQPSLLRALARAYGMPYLALGIIKLVNDLLNFAGPVLLNLLLRYLSDDDSWRDFLPAWVAVLEAQEFGYLCAGLLGLTAVIKAILNSQYSYVQGCISCQLRSALTCAVFRKSLLLGSVAMSSFSTGAVQTMMSVDADRIVNLASGLHELWSLPMQIAIALYLLYTQVRYAFLAGLAVVLLLFPVNRWIALRIQSASIEMMASKDNRIRVLGELLRGMQQIKISAWEACFVERVEAARWGELRALSTRKYLDALCVYFWAATSLLFSLSTFGLYVLLGNRLSASVVFTSLALFGVLLAPLNSFPWVVNGVVEAWVSVGRLQNLLAAKEMDPLWAYAQHPPAHTSGDEPHSMGSFASNASEAAAASSGRGSGASSSSAIFGMRFQAFSSGTSTPVLGAMHRWSSHGAGNVSPGSAITAAPRSSSSNALQVNDDIMAAVVDEVMNEGLPTLERPALQHPSQLLPSVPSLAGSVSFGGSDPRPDLPAVLVDDASFSWSEDESVREELGPCAEDDACSTSYLTITRGANFHVRDVKYGVFGGRSWLYAQPSLKNIKLTVGRGSLTAIVGEVGSGKSSLLCALLGEMQGCSGRVMLRGSVAYVGQQPWIMSGTVRENILFGTAFNKARYMDTVRSCCLEPDLAAWPLRDLTIIGDRGATLSGGQRGRLALARAVYQDSDIYLLDDVLAAVDGHVSASLVENVICGNVLGGKTRIIVTHAPACIAKADTLLRMYRGRIAYCGPPEDDNLRMRDLATWFADSRPAPGGPLLGSSDSADLSEPHLDPNPSGALAEWRRVKSDMTPLPSAWQSSSAQALSRGSEAAGVHKEIEENAPSLDIVPKVSVFVNNTEDHSTRQLPTEPLLPGQPNYEASDLLPEASTSGKMETREEGHVKWDVYVAYMMATGRFMTILILSSLLLMQATRNANDLFLAYWATSNHEREYVPRRIYVPWLGLPLHAFHPRVLLGLLPWGFQSSTTIHPAEHAPTPFAHGASVPHAWSLQDVLKISDTTYSWLYTLLAIAIANSAMTLVRAFSFAMGGLAAAQRLHKDLLTAVVQAPVDFFDRTPAGRILNRFSSDVATADDSLPFTLNILLAAVAQMVGLLAVLGFSQPWLLIAFLPLGILYRQLQVYYQGSSREIRRLQSTTRSPVYTTFNEVLDGGASIRAFRQQAYFLHLNESQMADLQKANMAGVGAGQWLSLRLQMIAAVLVSCVAVLAVLDHEWVVPSAASQEDRRLGGAGLVGLSLSYVLPLTGLLNQLLTTSAETEQEMVAVERILEYTRLEPQALTVEPLKHSAAHLGEYGFGDTAGVPANWPLNGSLIFDDVWLRYSRHGPWALAGLTVSIAPGEKVGVCGRTGAGKSSLVSALLRLREISLGAILMAGADLRAIPLPRLRSVIGVVPQAPFLFEGSVRDNLDPLRQHGNRELIGVLKHVRLWDILCGLSLSQSKVGERSEESSRGRPPAGLRTGPTTSSSSAAVPPASPRSRRSPENSVYEGSGTPLSSPPNKSMHLARTVNFTDNPFAGRPPALPLGSPEREFLLAAAEEGRQGQGHPLTQAGLSEILPDPSGPLSPPSSSVGGDATSLSHFLQGRWYDLLANESTGVLVNAGFGAQLLATRLGEGGIGLSQGQQQLLCLARVLLKRPMVVCLDECTANVDPNTAAVMQELIESQLERSTVIQVAHRLDSVLDCDRVIVLEGGRPVEQGPPRHLLRETQSCFAAMYYAAARERQGQDEPKHVTKPSADLSDA